MVLCLLSRIRTQTAHAAHPLRETLPPLQGGKASGTAVAHGSGGAASGCEGPQPDQVRGLQAGPRTEAAESARPLHVAFKTGNPEVGFKSVPAWRAGTEKLAASAAAQCPWGSLRRVLGSPQSGNP
jgi:hypothetical protein